MWGFYCVGVCMCGFSNSWLCVCECFVVCASVYVWVL